MTKTLSNLQIPIFKPWALIIASGCFEMNENVNWEWAHVFLSCSPHTQPLVLSKRVRVMRNKNKTIYRKISLVFFKELLGICDVWNISESISESLLNYYGKSLQKVGVTDSNTSLQNRVRKITFCFSVVEEFGIFCQIDRYFCHV